MLDSSVAAQRSSWTRRMRGTRFAAALILVGLLQASSCDTSGSGGHTYTPKFRVDCDHRALALEDTVEPILSVDNSTGHSWGSTFVFLQGDHDFRIEAMSMNGQPLDNIYFSAGEWGLGSLAAGDTGEIHIRLRAKRSAEPKVEFTVWATSDANATPIIPDSTYTASCEYVIQ
jgi:hypothetical protein